MLILIRKLLFNYSFQNIPKLYEYFIEIMTEDPTREVKAVYKVLLNTLLTVLNDLNMSVDEWYENGIT